MNKMFYPFALAVLAAACQHNAPPIAKVVINSSVSVIALNEATPVHQAIAPADTLTPEMLTLLR